MRPQDHHGRFAGCGFALLLAGQFITTAGNQVQDVAMMLWLKDLTGSAAVMGTAMLLSNLPEALLAPLGGRLADRIGRVRTMIFADLIAAAAVAAVMLAAGIGTPAAALVAVLFFGNLVVGVSSAGFGPAVSALIPDLVSSERLARGNAAHQFSGISARLAGQGLSGLLYAGLGAIGALAVNAASFLVSAACSAGIRETHKPKAEIASPPSFVLVLANRTTRRLLLYVMAFHFCLSVLPVTLPFYAEHVLGVPGRWLGLLIAADTAGVMLGFVMAGVFPRPEDRFRPIAWAGLGVGSLFGILALAGSAWVAVPALIGIGAGIGFIVVNLITELQLRAPTDQRAATLGVAQAVGGSSLPVGMALTGCVLDALTRWGVGYSIAAPSVLAAAAVAACALTTTTLLTGGVRDTRGRRFPA